MKDLASAFGKNVAAVRDLAAVGDFGSGGSDFAAVRDSAAVRHFGMGDVGMGDVAAAIGM